MYLYTRLYKNTPCHSSEGRELVEQARVELAYGNDPRVAFATGDTDTAPTRLGVAPS